MGGLRVPGYTRNNVNSVLLAGKGNQQEMLALLYARARGLCAGAVVGSDVVRQAPTHATRLVCVCARGLSARQWCLLPAGKEATLSSESWTTRVAVILEKTPARRRKACVKKVARIKQGEKGDRA